MRAIDTNVLIRFLVRDDIQQSEDVYKLFKQVESDKKELFVPMLVLLETIWVLESVYSTPRLDIIDAVDEMLSMPILKFETQPAVQFFLLSAREKNTELSDLLIACSAKFSGCETVLTFDKHASKFEYFELIS